MEDAPDPIDIDLEPGVPEGPADLRFRAEPSAPRLDWVGKASSFVPPQALKLAMRLQTNQRALGVSVSRGVRPVGEKRRRTPVFASPSEIVSQTIAEAKSLIARSETDAAIDLLQTRIRDGLPHADLFYLLGETLRTRERLDEAEEALLSALAMKLHSPYAYYSLGLLYLDQERLDRAVPLLQHFLSQIEQSEGHYQLGRALVACGNFVEAAVHFTRALEMTAAHKKEEVCSLLVLRADAYEGAGRPDLAKADFREIRRLAPRFHEPYVRYAEELEARGSKPEAQRLRAFLCKLFE